jgi:hypothetical protein
VRINEKKYENEYGNIAGIILTGEKGNTQRRNCPSFTFPATDPPWTDSGAYPARRGKMLWPLTVTIVTQLEPHIVLNII